jgi:hypothetical protein
MALRAPKDKKAERSDRGYGGYAYRSAEDIIAALKPMLEKHKLILVLRDKVEQIGTRMYVKSTVVLRDFVLNQEACAFSYAQEAEKLSSMSAGQITGATISYARKYALGALFAIDGGKDLDDVASEDIKKEKKNESAKDGRASLPHKTQQREEW